METLVTYLVTRDRLMQSSITLCSIPWEMYTGVVRACTKSEVGPPNLLDRYSECDNVKSQDDQDLLGIFISNHDNPRWLNRYNYDHIRMKSALAFMFFSKGIPFFYYGDEQGFAGGSDPGCREPLWNDLK